MFFYSNSVAEFACTSFHPVETMWSIDYDIHENMLHVFVLYSILSKLFSSGH